MPEEKPERMIIVPYECVDELSRSDFTDRMGALMVMLVQNMLGQPESAETDK